MYYILKYIMNQAGYKNKIDLLFYIKKILLLYLYQDLYKVFITYTAVLLETVQRFFNWCYEL